MSANTRSFKLELRGKKGCQKQDECDGGKNMKDRGVLLCKEIKDKVLHLKIDFASNLQGLPLFSTTSLTNI